MCRLLTIIFLAILTHTSHARDLAVYGAGNILCSRWLYGREQSSPTPEVRELTFAGQMWVLGYLSAANVYELHFAPGGPLSSDAIYQWIDTYCRAHPNDRISAAIQAMIVDARTRR